MRLKLLCVAALALACIGGNACAQSNFTLSLNAPHPSSFNTGPSGTAAQLTNLVRSEALGLVLQSTPTPSGLPPAQLTPRRISLWLGAEAAIPAVFPQGPVFINLAGPPPAVVLFDSFTQPWAPMFASPQSGASSSVPLTLAANLFGPLFGAALPTMVLQGYCEDSPGNPVLLSNAVRFQIVDPETAGFAPAIADVQPQALSGTGVLRPQGSELGGNAVTLNGANFLAQSDWISRPPHVLFGTQESPLVYIVDNTTLFALAPATIAPTNPPFTNAGLVNVSIQNDSDISPAAATHLAPQQYLYLSGQTPVIAASSIPFPPPEGGVLQGLLGSGFLNLATVTMRSVANPALSATVNALAVGAGGTLLAYAMPAFCTGPVQCTVTNIDEVVSAPFILNIAAQAPVLLGGSPSLTVHPALGGGTHLIVSAAGSTLTIAGSGFLTATSPLASAPTVPPTLFFPTRARIGSTLLANVVPVSTTTLSGVVAPVSATGLYRPNLGVRTLELENPPGVNTGNAAPITNASCAPNAAPCAVLVQDTQPPQALVFFPGLVPASGCSRLRISGANFFSVEVGTTTVDYSPFANLQGVVPLLPLSALRVPAVLFGDRFAPRVTIVSETELEVEVPDLDALVSSNIVVTVFNPDGQAAVLATPLIVAPSLTDTATLTSAMFSDLDATALVAMAAGLFVPGGAPSGDDAPALLLVRNPTPQRDRAQDPYATTLPAGISYDFALLFNTRASDGSARAFNFNNIDLPATITLPAAGSAIIPPLDLAIPVGGSVNIPLGTTLRVIVKATGFARTVSGRWVFDVATNHSLVLAGHDMFRMDALVNLNGGALVPESLLVSHPQRVRVETTFAPAGAGRGGRGGSHGSSTLLALPSPNFSATAAQLVGWSGAPPADRSVLPLPGVRTEGTGGVAAVPLGIQAGGGGGAGAAANGLNGFAGSVGGGLGGFAFGNATFPGANPMGTPPSDCFIFGSTIADFQLFASGGALDSGKLHGGSGGGGGAGVTALFVPAQSIGGRGGNGGGALVLLGNCVLELGAHAALLCNGEQGQMGLDVFPFAGSNPALPVCLPGAGGGGSGGTILIVALAHVSLPFAGASPAGPIPSGAIFAALGGLGGPPPGTISAGSTVGGAASIGRLRMAARSNSPHLADLESAFNNLTQQGLIAPTPSCASAPPPLPLPLAFFSWPGL